MLRIDQQPILGVGFVRVLLNLDTFLILLIKRHIMLPSSEMHGLFPFSLDAMMMMMMDVMVKTRQASQERQSGKICVSPSCRVPLGVGERDIARSGGRGVTTGQEQR